MIKQVVLKSPENTVEVEQTVPTKYYGVARNANWRGFVAGSYRAGMFHVSSLRHITSGATSNGYIASTVPGTIAKCLCAGCVVYEFDTPQELAAWLARAPTEA